MSASTHYVIYDGDCPLCTFQMKLLTWMDWLNQTTLVPLANEKVQTLVPDLSREALMSAIHCLDTSGRIHRGARCIRFLSMRMPLLIPLGLVLWFPGVILIAEKIYQWISRNRLILSRVFGCKDACGFVPERKRDQEDIFHDPH